MKLGFSPCEVLFSVTGRCNLSCPHCTVEKTTKTLSKAAAIKFLRQCKKQGIEKVSFTGGEPFLVPDFLYALAQETIAREMFFGQIMTNAVWFRSPQHLRQVFSRLHRLGYDGSLCVSVDAFHNPSVKKLSFFIKTALSIWQRGDVVSLVHTAGVQNKDLETKKILQELAAVLRAELVNFSSRHGAIRNDSLFIKLTRIDLSPVAGARSLKNPWEGEWFKEDYCQGPGNILFVMPNGEVKPCCGYACELDELTIGNIKRDSPAALIKGAGRNRYVFSVFNKGLSRIRKDLQKLGVKFPGSAGNHCFFCYYLLKEIPRPLLNKAMLLLGSNAKKQKRIFSGPPT